MGSVVLVSELLHEVGQGLNTLHGHSIIEACTAATNGSVTLKFDKACFGGFLKELGLELIILLDAERNVHAGAIARVYWGGEVVT